MSQLRLLDDYDLSGNKQYEALPLGPEGVLHGQMPNGMSYVFFAHLTSSDPHFTPPAFWLLFILLDDRLHPRQFRRSMGHLAPSKQPMAGDSCHHPAAIRAALGPAAGTSLNYLLRKMHLSRLDLGQSALV